MSPPLAEITDLPMVRALRRLRPGRYAYLTRKYWRMNPWRPWWVLHM
ncbi:hypothetical protein [Streptosporangium roseum]